MRRRAPRPLAPVLARLAEQMAPATTLARVQRCWGEAAGDAIAREAEPVAERDGVLTVACRSSVWAQELELMSADLLARLNEELDGPAPERDGADAGAADAGRAGAPAAPPTLRALRVRTGRLST
ncbi:MAG TPA: DUF721 domain-containing protein [Thermoleophilaceae bacterium]